jgi:hypothetical protein
MTEDLGGVGLAMALTRHADPGSFWRYRDHRERMEAASEVLARGVPVRGGGPAEGRY